MQNTKSPMARISTQCVETMESRTLLSAGAPGGFVHVLRTTPIAVEARRAAAGEGWVGSDGESHDHWFSSGETKSDRSDQPEIFVGFGSFHVIRFNNHHDGSPRNGPQGQADGDSDDGVARPSAQGSDRPQAVPVVALPVDESAGVAMRVSSPAVSVSSLLHDNATASISARASVVPASTFSTAPTVSLRAGKSGMIYLSEMGQAGNTAPFFKAFVQNVKIIVDSFPAVAVRATGIALFATGGEVLSIASPAMVEIARFASPFTLVADSVGSFIQSSAMIPSAREIAPTRQAWMVTLAVISADALLLTYYIQRRRKAQMVLVRDTH